MSERVEHYGHERRASRAAARAWACIPSAALALGGLAVSAHAYLAPKDQQTVTAIFAPWWSAERAFMTAAGEGAVVAVGPAPFLVTITDTAPHLAERLRAAGAVAIINPSNALLCGAKPARR